MPTLRIALLGGFEARLDAEPAAVLPRRKAQALLAYLALQAGQRQPRDKLAALLWGDAPDERARHSLRQALVTLRPLLARTTPPGLVETGEGVGLDETAVDLDVRRFERLVRDATPEALEQAADLYRGDLLAGLAIQEAPLEEWLLGERERLRELAIEALTRLLAHQTGAGAVDRAVRTALRLLVLDPTLEVVHRALMRLYARQGRRGAALRQYQVCCDVLQRELEVEPEDQTRRLYEDLLTTPAPSPGAVVGVLAAAERVALPGSATELVGRTVEHVRLLEACREAWAGAGGRVTLVLGEAGVGKTRLVEAVLAEVTEPGTRLVIGRARESEQVLPFGLWVEALRDAGVVAELEEDQEPAWRASPWRAELARLFPELGPSNRLPAAGEDYVRLFEALRHLLGQLLVQTRLVVVLEDLHWADDMSLRLLAFLSRRAAEAPLFLLVTAREEDVTGNPWLPPILDELDREDRLRRVPLGPLSRDETGALVGALARSGTGAERMAALVERVWAISEGSPFVIVETMRAAREGQSDVTEGRLALPERARRLVAGRLERLSPGGRSLAALGAVVGREFPFTLLAAAAERDAVEVARDVEELVARRILHVVGERLDFAHDRIREVAYTSLLPSTRRLHHRAVARAIETFHADDLDAHCLALGRHWREGEDWKRAFDYLRRAGWIATRRAAHRDAVACLEQALEALQHLPGDAGAGARAIDVRFEIRQSCAPLADQSRALLHLDAAAAEAALLGDRRRLGWAEAFRTNARFVSGDFDEALAAGARALAIADELDDPGLRLGAQLYLGQVRERVGDYGPAATALRENVQVLEPEVQRRGDLEAPGRLYSRVFQLDQHGDAARLGVFSRTFLTWCLAEVGEFAEAMASGEEAVRLAEAHESAYEWAHAGFGLAMVLLRRGDVLRARDLARRGVELCETRDFPILWLPNATLLGLAEARTGQAAGVPRLEGATAIAGPHAGPVVTCLGEAYLLTGRIAEAGAASERALGLTRTRGERGWHAWALHLAARVAASRGPAGRPTAERWFRETAELAAVLGMAPLVAHSRLGLGTLSVEAGRLGEGRADLDAAALAYRTMNMPAWLEQAGAILARVSG